jgi:hypothetical protein
MPSRSTMPELPPRGEVRPERISSTAASVHVRVSGHFPKLPPTPSPQGAGARLPRRAGWVEQPPRRNQESS